MSLLTKNNNTPLFWRGVNGVVNLRQQNHSNDDCKKFEAPHIKLEIDNVTLNNYTVREL